MFLFDCNMVVQLTESQSNYPKNIHKTLFLNYDLPFSSLCAPQSKESSGVREHLAHIP